MFLCPVIPYMHDKIPYDLKFCLDYAFCISLDDGMHDFFGLNFHDDT